MYYLLLVILPVPLSLKQELIEEITDNKKGLCKGNDVVLRRRIGDRFEGDVESLQLIKEWYNTKV